MTTYYVLCDNGIRRYPDNGETFVVINAHPPVIRTAIPEFHDHYRLWALPEDFAILHLEAVLVRQGDTGVVEAGNNQ